MDGYDEDARLCTAARRPPVEETSSFLMSLLASHGPNYLEKLFGPKARNNMQNLGGVENVAIALSGEQCNVVPMFAMKLVCVKSLPPLMTLVTRWLFTELMWSI